MGRLQRLDLREDELPLPVCARPVVGSSRTLTENTGTVPDDSYRYDAFGALRGSTGASEQPFRFTGQRPGPREGFAKPGSLVAPTGYDPVFPA